MNIEEYREYKGDRSCGGMVSDVSVPHDLEIWFRGRSVYKIWNGDDFIRIGSVSKCSCSFIRFDKCNPPRNYHQSNSINNHTKMPTPDGMIYNDGCLNNIFFASIDYLHILKCQLLNMICKQSRTKRSS